MVRPVKLRPPTQQPPVSLGGLPWPPVPIKGAQATPCRGSVVPGGLCSQDSPPTTLHLTAGLGAACRSPSFPPGEAEGLELGSPSGRLREEHQE